MSYKALSWALQQKDLKPATKIVLICLADRHNPDYGCFPSISKIAEDAEMSQKSVFTHLSKLEKAGLIARSGRIKNNGQQTSNEYKLFRGVKNLQGDYAKPAPMGVKNLQTNLVSINHVNETNRSTDLFDAYFDQWWSMYPRKVQKSGARKAALKSIKLIEPHELTEKLTKYVDSIKNTPVKFIPHLATWLNGERWNDDIEVDDPQNVDHAFRNMVTDLARVTG